MEAEQECLDLIIVLVMAVVEMVEETHM